MITIKVGEITISGTNKKELDLALSYISALSAIYIRTPKMTKAGIVQVPIYTQAQKDAAKHAIEAGTDLENAYLLITGTSHIRRNADERVRRISQEDAALERLQAIAKD